jgi:GAF domain-containing protein
VVAVTLKKKPIRKNDKPIGNIHHKEEIRAFTERRVGLLSNFANQAVIAIENTPAERTTQSLQQQPHRRRAQGHQPIDLRFADGA